MKFFLLLFLLVSCQSKDENEIWIYTSLYKDTIADVTPYLAKAFPGVKINWYQAGSEEIAAKVNTELIAGVPKADILISSERFWYQELADSGRLVSWKPSQYESFRPEYQYPEGNFHIVSVPIMVLAYNSEVMKADEAPKSFHDLALPKYKNIATGGSPLASGTAFTTVLALYEKYGWDFFHELRKNGFLFDGGNSAVLKRIQTKERPVGFVLLENVLRFQHDDPRLKVIYPEDGVVTQFNTMGIPKKKKMRPEVLKVAEWFFTEDGQKAMTRSFMHSPLKNFPPPEGARDLSELKAKAFAWTPELIHELTEKRFEIKENYVEIMFK
ncbi:MAG: extracellular solute-binding protein [Bacteriovoracaceae bacterium]